MGIEIESKINLSKDARQEIDNMKNEKNLNFTTLEKKVEYFLSLVDPLGDLDDQLDVYVEFDVVEIYMESIFENRDVENWQTQFEDF